MISPVSGSVVQLNLGTLATDISSSDICAGDGSTGDGASEAGTSNVGSSANLVALDVRGNEA